MSGSIYVGVDLGGTAIKVGICDKSGKLLHTYEGPTGPTGARENAEGIATRIEQYVRKIVTDASYSMEQVAGVGAGIPGFLDIPGGIVIESPNIPGMSHFPLKQVLQDRLGKTVVINNDANVAALGEAWGGAGAGIPDLVCYTLGTGVGGGIIINGKIHQGFSGMAGELGHMQIVPDIEAIACGCGHMGCLETVSSATGVVRMAKDAVERGEQTSLSLIDELTAKDVFIAAAAGDESSLRIVHRAAYYLGRSMAMLSIIVNPQRFILGGGMSKAGEVLFQPIREVFEKYSQPTSRKGVDIVPAVLGNDAGVVGAAGLIISS